MVVFRRRILIASQTTCDATDEDDVAASVRHSGHRVQSERAERMRATRVRATLEDDFHHFRVELHTQAGVVTAVQGQAIRFPYTMCPNAAEPLRELEGMALSPIANSVTRRADASGQCTHLFELAGLAIAAAARGIPQREYRIEVPMRVDERTAPRLWRDGALVLAWQVDGQVITGPPPFSGINLREGLARWALTTLTEDEAEAVLVLRRATAISIGRTKQLDDQLHASSTGFCFSQQPVRAEQALRIVGSTWDFTPSSAAASLCESDAAWLAFADQAPALLATAATATG